MNKYNVSYVSASGLEMTVVIFAPDGRSADRQFQESFPSARYARVRFLSEATAEEIEQINNTGAPHPKHGTNHE